MSRYKLVQTEFRNWLSLEKAIRDLKIEVYISSQGATTNDLPLYGYRGDLRPEQVGVRIPRNFVDRNWSGGCSNDIGFRWDGQTFVAVVSEYDSGCIGVQAALQQIKQHYAYHEIHRQARVKGYTVSQTTRMPDGTIRLHLHKR